MSSSKRKKDDDFVHVDSNVPSDEVKQLEDAMKDTAISGLAEAGNRWVAYLNKEFISQIETADRSKKHVPEMKHLSKEIDEALSAPAKKPEERFCACVQALRSSWDHLTKATTSARFSFSPSEKLAVMISTPQPHNEPHYIAQTIVGAALQSLQQVLGDNVSLLKIASKKIGYSRIFKEQDTLKSFIAPRDFFEPESQVKRPPVNLSDAEFDKWFEDQLKESAERLSDEERSVRPSWSGKKTG